MKLLPKILATTTGTCLLASSLQAALVHRYSFNETGGDGTTLVDSVGGADGLIVNGGANEGTVGGGSLSLSGGAQGSSDWASFPANIVTTAGAGGTAGDVTIEVWGTTFSAQNWSRVFSFGSATDNVMHMSWSRGTDTNLNELRWNNTGSGANNITLQDFGPNVLSVESHWLVTLDDIGGLNPDVTVYFNGAEVDSGNVGNTISDLTDNDIWLGRSQWPDNTAHADFDEFRIYNTALSAADAATSFARGADTIPEPGSFALLGLGVAGLVLRRRRK